MIALSEQLWLSSSVCTAGGYFFARCGISIESLVGHTDYCILYVSNSRYQQQLVMCIIYTVLNTAVWWYVMWWWWCWIKRGEPIVYTTASLRNLIQTVPWAYLNGSCKASNGDESADEATQSNKKTTNTQIHTRQPKDSQPTFTHSQRWCVYRRCHMSAAHACSRQCVLRRCQHRQSVRSREA